MQTPFKSLSSLSSDIKDADSQLAGYLKENLKYSVVEEKSCTGKLPSWEAGTRFSLAEGS